MPWMIAPITTPGIVPTPQAEIASSLSLMPVFAPTDRTLAASRYAAMPYSAPAIR
jgi:hypothetical protein